ncbi:MAG: FkbM family methyltransferase [Gemmatimonadales bacterium]
MPLLQALAAKVSGFIGRESRPVRLLRPVYEALLDLWSWGHGYLHTVNGIEQFYVAPRNRGLYPTSYDAPVMDYLRAHVRPGQTCINAGANAGVYTMCLALWAGPDGHAYAFEPNPAMRKVIEDTARRSGLDKRITACAEAIGAEPGSATLQVADDMTGCTRLDQPNPEAEFKHVAHRPLTVPVTTLDRFCAEHAVTPDWVMMDIEGYEVAALRGAREMVLAGRGRLGLIVETHPVLWEISGSSRQDFERLLGELGLRAVPLTGQGDPFGERGIVSLEYVA